MRESWSPTQESLEKLLEWLNSNREDGADKYERIRLRLIKYFTCNGCGDDDEHLADETIDRVMRRLERGEIPEPFTGDKVLYFLAFAKNVRQEHYAHLRQRETTPPLVVIDRTEKEDEDVCLTECVGILEKEDRWLAVKYYSFEKTTKVGNRKKLADQFGLGVAGLRTRIYRVRERLRPCIEECLKRRSG